MRLLWGLDLHQGSTSQLSSSNRTTRGIGSPARSIYELLTEKILYSTDAVLYQVGGGLLPGK
jgi:hypothetical protein